MIEIGLNLTKLIGDLFFVLLVLGILYIWYRMISKD